MKKILLDKPKQDILIAFDFLIVVILLVFAGIWAWHKFMTSAPYVDEARYPIRGIDISSHNGDVDLDAAANDNVRFAFIKATEGVDFQDENFKTNYNKAKRAGIKTGAYHFFRFDKDGVEQAINFLRTIGNRNFELGLAVDVEKNGNRSGIPPDSISYRLVTMIDYLNLKGYRVTLYSNRDGYAEYLMQTFPGYPLWICSFSEIPFNGEWTFWQYDHHGKVAGIEGDVDLNVFCGSEKEWTNFLSGALWPYESQ